MTTVALESPTSTGRLEELVDRLLAALFRADPEPPAQVLARTIHEARRLRQAGDPGGALAALADADTGQAAGAQFQWLYSEWLDIARRRYAGAHGAVLYSPATGRAAVLVPCKDGDGGNALEVAATLGMRWLLGKRVSRRSLRGLRPLLKGGA